MTEVNEFAVRIATANGSGSASVNGLLMKAMFRMGIPVSGRNLLPSNIQGLPTWFEIRASATNHTARTSHHDLLVAMNTQTYDRDIRGADPGSYVLHDSTWPLPAGLARNDVNFLAIPLAEMCADRFSDIRQRVLMKNIAYAGAVTALLALDRSVVEELLDETFGGRGPAAAEDNAAALQIGYGYALEHFPCPLPFHVVRSDRTRDMILAKGNFTTALGCLYAGAVVAAWYPITPATSVAESFARLCDRYRQDPGHGYLVLQAEDELAACGMVVGASWAGARAFTSTSGPGISLMNEILGLAYYAEIPTVIFDVQRAGPSTGMPTRTQQADLLTCAYASHGDTKHILLFPSDPAECFEFAVRAFDLAEHFQTPVIVLSDLDIGMNDWSVPRLTWDDGYRPDRGRMLGAAELEERSEFARYAGADLDSVCARTRPGVSERGAYFARGSGHDRFAHYTEDPDAYQEVVDRLARKHDAARSAVPLPIVETGHRPGGARPGIITLGSCDPAVREARELLAADGLETDYMRVRGFPFGPEVATFLAEHETCFVVEQNRDAQLRSLLILEGGATPGRLWPVLAYDGIPLDATRVAYAVVAEMEGLHAVH